MIQHKVSEYLKRNGPAVARYIQDLKAVWGDMSEADKREARNIVTTALHYDQVKDRIAWTNFLNCVS